MTLEITFLSELPETDRSRALNEAEAIFFATSNTQTFASEAVRESFRQRWFARYIALCPEAFLVVQHKDEVIGYVAGCFDSFAEAMQPIRQDIPYYTPAFCQALAAYPAHFHINMRPDAQGQGQGRQLLTRFLQTAEARHQSGVHVVTGIDTPAAQFYQACGFRFAPAIEGASPRAAILICNFLSQACR